LGNAKKRSVAVSKPTANSAGKAHRTPPCGTSKAARNAGATAVKAPKLAATRASTALAPRPIGA